MSETVNKNPGLFELLYAAGKQAFDEIKKPMVKNKIKRKLHAAFDDADLKIGQANLAINKEREKFDDYDINKVLEQRAVIKKCKELQVDIKDEYLELFGKEMVIEIED